VANIKKGYQFDNEKAVGSEEKTLTAPLRACQRLCKKNSANIKKHWQSIIHLNHIF